MENYEIFRMCVTARAVAASSAPRMRRQVMRHPPFWSGGAGARSSARRHIKPMTQADRLTSWAGKRSESGATRPGESSLSCRQHIRSTHASEAEAANEDAGRVRRRSGAIEYPHQPAAGQALSASEASSGRRPEGHCFLQFPRR